MLSEVRRRQRAHAKKRFEQRFALNMNRDQIHEIEVKIASGQAVLVERRPQIKNYLLSVNGELVVVGYNTLTKRVVTALPKSYREKLPREVIHPALFRLLGDDRGIVLDIANGTNAQLLYRQSQTISFYLVQYPGFRWKTGYDCEKNCLLPYVREESLRPPCSRRFEVMELDETLRSHLIAKVQSGDSQFLWRYSNQITFHQVDLNGTAVRFGYSSGGHKIYVYEDPSIDD